MRQLCHAKAVIASPVIIVLDQHSQRLLLELFVLAIAVGTTRCNVATGDVPNNLLVRQLRTYWQRLT